MPIQKIRTFLWFDTQAEEAAIFYVSLFPNSKITGSNPGPNGLPMVVTFRLDGVEFIALNGGPHFKFNEAISLSVDCANQAEVDDLWEKLTAGGSPSQCGWLKDRFGLSWQIVPTELPQMLFHPQRGAAVMQAMLPMSKLNIQELQAAFDGAA